MSRNVIVVESPAKAKTIEKYLGKDYKVLASYGHVRDLLPKKGSVDPEAQFAMRYEAIEKNEKHVTNIAKALKGADNLYLATDPDREGEAISWHVQELLKAKGNLKDKSVYRVAFYEITKSAIKAAMDNPREVEMDLVNAQQARRALDYLVGFNLSPLLWKKIKRGLSAGRVQSPALRLIVEREEAIEAFKSEEYWSITGDCQKSRSKFQAKLKEFDGEKQEQFTITDEKTAEKVQKAILKAADSVLTVEKVEKKQRKRQPAAPFITSTLQQEAARKIGFSAQKTMRIAQQLYEGIDIGIGTVGLITYMRTDSVNVSNEAIDEIREYITEQYGAKDLPDSPRVFKKKSKNAQEAHEAIRPTSITRTPTKMKEHLSRDQFRLYDLVWKRTLASQMVHATINTVGIDLICDNAVFRANGSTIDNPGFLQVYQEGIDDPAAPSAEDNEKQLPPLEKGDEIKLNDVETHQHFTEPPPRYSEASLVKALEEFGIGRPSTYASIISTLQARDYALLEKKRFTPTDIGKIVVNFLKDHFKQYVDFDFTANLEDELDAISRGEKEWVPVLDHFWHPFTSLIKTIDETVSRQDVTTEAMDEDCPDCGKPLMTRLGRRGKFVGCSGYPECSYTRNVDDEEGESSEPEVVEGRNCPKCESDLIIRMGRYGKFIGCSNYPECKHIEPLEKPEDSGVTCPECNKNTILKRKSRRGKIFYSCGGYPTCKYAIWNEPVDEACPKCQWPITAVKTTKRRGTERLCPQKECDFIETLEEPEK